jgi:hypothetical protein
MSDEAVTIAAQAAIVTASSLKSCELPQAVRIQQAKMRIFSFALYLYNFQCDISYMGI